MNVGFGLVMRSCDSRSLKYRTVLVNLDTLDGCSGKRFGVRL